MTPELQSILISAVITIVSLWIAIAKLLPNIIEKREAIWEERQKSVLADEQSKRDEDASQRVAITELIKNQIKIQEGTMAFTTQLIEVNAQNSATQIATEKSILQSTKVIEANAKAVGSLADGIAANTEAINEQNKHFAQLLTEGSTPLQLIGRRVETGFTDQDAALKIISVKLDSLQVTINEIRDELLTCIEAKKVIVDNPAIVQTVDQSERDMSVVKATLNLGIVEEKHKSKEIPTIRLDPGDKQEGAQGAPAA